MTDDMLEMVVGLVFLTVFIASQLLVLPAMGGNRADSRKLKQRLEGILATNSEAESSIIKEKYLNRLSPFERRLEQLPGMSCLKTLLEQTGKSQAAYQFVLYSLLLAAGTALMAQLFFHQLLLTIGTFVVAAILPIVWLKKQISKRMAKFEEQLPEALEMMSRALRTGYPFMDCLKMVSTDMNEPISQEFGMTYVEINYGRDVEVAFALMIERVPSLSLIAMTTAILIQRETGGNLSEVILNISSVLKGRFQLQRRIKTLSAEGLMSAWAMLLLPVALFGALNWVSPDYFKPIYNSPDRMMFLYILLGLELCAAFWIRIIINIDA